MIAIKTDRGWFKFKTWQEVEELPGYIKDINPKVIKLKKVMGPYREPELRVCGLSTCRHKHYKGFIVELEDGRVTNIGADCGNTHLGVEFDVQSRQIVRDWASQERREAINSAKNRVEGWQKECEQLRNGEHGASWLLKQNKAMRDQNNGLPDTVTRFLQDAVRTGDNSVYTERAATQQEREIAKETGQGNLPFIKENVGTLTGMAGLSEINSLRDILAVDLEVHLKILVDLDVESLTDKDLQFWAKWCSEVDGKIDKVRSIIKDTQRFFTRENIGLLFEMVQGDEGKQVMKFAKQYQ
jgi:hypothetical protein